MRTLYKTYILALLFYGVQAFTICFSQPFYFKHFTTENGLSHNTVLSVLQDKKGFIWLGTKTGLNRFDGFSFKSFKNSKQPFGTIGDDQIHAMCADSGGNLWLGTGRGIYKFDPRTEKFDELLLRPYKGVHAIVTDARHQLWFLASDTLWRFDIKNRVVKNLHISATCLSIDNQGKLWMGTGDGRLRRYDPLLGSSKTYQVLNRGLPLNTRNISKVLPMPNESLLIGTSKTGLLCYNPNTAKTDCLLSRNADGTEVNVRDILATGNNTYWIATESGLFIYDQLNKRSINLKKDPSDPYAINDNAIYALHQDINGGIWIGTYFGGLNYYTPQNAAFKKYYHIKGTPSIAGNAVSAICEDDNRNIWVGTEDAGISRLNPKTGAVLNLVPNGKANGIGDANVHSLARVGNKLYIGLFNHGLEVLDLKKSVITEKYEQLGEQTGLRSNFVLCLLPLGNKQIYLGTIGPGSGLYVFNEERKTFGTLPGLNYHDGVFALAQDHAGMIWIGSANKGTFCFNRGNHVLSNFHFEKFVNAKEATNQHTIHCIFEDREFNLWFGTEGGGVVKLSKNRKTVVRYTTANGLSSNYVYRIVEDNNHDIWMSSVTGLMKLNQKTGKISTYKEDNGLATNQFNYSASLKSSDGLLYFGSVKGLIAFNPETIAQATTPPPIFITGLEINNQTAHPGDSISGLKRSITYTDSVKLTHDKNNLNIEFAALNYSAPNEISYKYVMHGLNENWNYLNTNRKVYFTGLAPGRYTFEVYGQSNTNNWHSQRRLMYIEIMPPFYYSNLARTLYVFALCIAFYCTVKLYKNRVNQRHQRNLELYEYERTQEIYQAKIDFFTNVAHELRTPLTLIKLPLDQILAVPSANEKMNENLNMIKKNTSRLIELTNQLLNFRKTDRENLTLFFVKANVNAILQDVFDDFQIAANQKNIRYQLNLPKYITLHADLDTEAFRKILVNLLSNAVKYAESEISVSILPLNSTDDSFSIEVKNDGPLLPEKYHQKIFEPFFRLNENDKQAGSGIGLSLALSLTLMHKGSLRVTTLHHFNIFTLQLPLLQETTVDIVKDQVTDATLTPVEAPISKAHEGFTVLLVEDNQDIVKYIDQELRGEYQILKATNGLQALAVLAGQAIDIVVSDIMMPVMDGIELCKRIKSDLSFSYIPVILLTAKTSVDAKIEGLGTGADAYIEKPFSLPHLQAQLKSLLKNRKLVQEHFARSPLSHIKGIAYSKADLNFLETLSGAINKRLTDASLSVETLSDVLNMSRPTLYRKIKALTDMTPSELISLFKLKRSAELLAEGGHKINEVAFMLGYTSPANFTRDFHKQFGITPSAYIKERG